MMKERRIYGKNRQRGGQTGGENYRRTGRLMNSQIHTWADIQRERRTDRQNDGLTDRYMDRQTDGLIAERIDRRTEQDRQTDGQTDGQIDKQTNI